ncbi:MAG: MMPL family transporter, partial [Propionibacteriaceae bacterium]|nr:MMPL family transporter [Propionibacteriaceae bacterium]
MSSLLYALGAWAVRARRWVIAGWCLLIAFIGSTALVFSAGLDSEISIPGLEASDALASLGRTFPQASGASAQILVVAADGHLVTEAAYERAIAAAIAQTEAAPQVSYVVGPFTEGVSGAVSEDRQAALVTAQISLAGGYVPDSVKDALKEITADLQAALPAGAAASLGGGIFSYTLPTVTLVEIFGVVAALVVLLLNFGSVVVAGMPIMVAVAGVIVSMSLIYLGTAVTSINTTTPILSLMLGLAVGIDYSLFIISRHRQQVVSGLPPAESVPRALATSGSAVVFAGLTVIVALLGLSVARIPFLTVMGAAAAVAVALAVLAALTLLPAVLAVAGGRLIPRAERRRRAAAAAGVSAGGKLAEPPETGQGAGERDQGQPVGLAAVEVPSEAIRGEAAADSAGEGFAGPT